MIDWKKPVRRISDGAKAINVEVRTDDYSYPVRIEYAGGTVSTYTTDGKSLSCDFEPSVENYQETPVIYWDKPLRRVSDKEKVTRVTKNHNIDIYTKSVWFGDVEASLTEDGKYRDSDDSPYVENYEEETLKFTRTRAGLPFRILATDLKGSKPLAVAFTTLAGTEDLIRIHADGKLYPGEESVFDLLTEPTFDPTKPVKTRSGLEARIHATDLAGAYPILYTYKKEGHWKADTTTAEGRASTFEETPIDLVNV